MSNFKCLLSKVFLFKATHDYSTYPESYCYYCYGRMDVDINQIKASLRKK